MNDEKQKMKMLGYIFIFGMLFFGLFVFNNAPRNLKIFIVAIPFGAALGFEVIINTIDAMKQDLRVINQINMIKQNFQKCKEVINIKKGE